MMAKTSTLIGMFLVQWLAISARILAAEKGNSEDSRSGKEPTEAQFGAWSTVLKQSEMAIQHDKYQSALALIAGVTHRLGATIMSDQKGQAQLTRLLLEIEDALKANDKAKALSFCDAVGRNFEHQHSESRAEKHLGKSPAGKQSRQLNEHAHHNTHEDAHAHPGGHPGGHPDGHEKSKETVDTYGPRQRVAARLQQVFHAINQNDMGKAKQLLRDFYHIMHDNRNLVSSANAAKFLHAIHQTEKHVNEGSVSQATHSLEEAATALGTASQLQEGKV